MKVLLVATVQSHICQFHRPLVGMLHQQGAQVHATARDNLAEKNGLSIAFVDRVFNIPFSRSPASPANIKAYRMLKAVIDCGGYDVVHCNTPVGGVVGRLAARAARKKGCKVFYTAHGFHFCHGSPFRNWLLYYPLEKMLARWTDTLLTITDEDYQLARRKFKTDVRRIHGVGVNPSRFYPLTSGQIAEMRAMLGFGEQDFLLLSVGELLRNKNQQALIRAVALLKGEIPGLKLLLAGNGPLRGELEGLAGSLGLQGQVLFLGYQPAIEKYTAICDIAVSASFREGLPLNIMEAMRCGKPVVASINRGHRELVRDGETGFLVGADDISAFSDRIKRLYEDFSLRKAMSESAVIKVETYTNTAVVNELFKVYFEPSPTGRQSLGGM